MFVSKPLINYFFFLWSFFFYVERVKLIRVCQKQRELSMLHTYKDSLKEFWLIHKHIHVNVMNYLSLCDFFVTIYANCLKIDPDESFINP